MQLQPNDKVVDIGCGDGRVLIHLAAHWTALYNKEKKDEVSESEQSLLSVSFVGLDINLERIKEASSALKNAQQDGRVHSALSIKFYCANAMDSKDLYQDATLFFLYLIPRGLKIFKPILLEILRERCEKRMAASGAGDSGNSSNNKGVLRVLTYMSPLPEEVFLKRQVCEVAHQPGAAWPVFLYHLDEECLPPIEEADYSNTKI